MTDVVLASGSSARQAMLRAAGIAFSVDVAAIDEATILESFEADGAKARDAADALAELKALRVSARHPGALVIGADQILSFNGKFFTKPADVSAARKQLQELRGKTHQLVSAAVAARNGVVVWRGVGETKMTMRAFSDEFLEDYLVKAGPEILSSVGACQVEGLGAQLFARIDGDYFTILGLPLLPVLDMLRTQGVLKS